MCVHLPVRVAQGRPVVGRRSCRGCRARGGQGLGAGCPKADQRSHTQGMSHLTLSHTQIDPHQPNIFYRCALHHPERTADMRAFHVLLKISINIAELLIRYQTNVYYAHLSGTFKNIPNAAQDEVSSSTMFRVQPS